MTSPHTHQLRYLRCVIGANIRNRRMQCNMTLARLSRLTKIGINRLDMFEMGKDEISVNHLFAIAMALDCKIASLFR